MGHARSNQQNPCVGANTRRAPPSLIEGSTDAATRDSMIAGAEHAPAKGPELARQMLLCRERRVRCCKRKCEDNYGPVAHHSSPCKEDGYNVLISYPLLTAPRRSSPGRDWTDAVLLPNDVLWDYYRRVLCGVSVSNKRVTQPSELCGQAWKSQPHMSEKSPI